MDDDEFKAAVIRGLDSLGSRMGDRESKVSSMQAGIGAHAEHFDKRLDGIVARLDEQDLAYDRMSEKVDRLGVSVRQSLEASEQVLASVTNLGRRVTRLEHPDE